MLFAAWIAGLALLVLVFQYFIDQGENPIWDFELSRYGGGRAQVMLGAIAPATTSAPGGSMGSPSTS